MGPRNVRRETRDGYAVLAIERLEHRNKINEATLQELREELRECVAAGAPAIVLTGSGGLFCTGGAVDDYPGVFAVERHASFSRAFIDLLVEMGRCPVPILARVNGDCLAGGTMLLARCDVAVCVDTARFGLPELDFGGFPMLALATALEQFPPKLVFDMAYLGRTLDAHEALALHLVNRMCAAEELDAQIAAVVGQLARRSAPAIRHGRRLFYALLRDPTEARLEQAATALNASAGDPAVRAAARPPDRAP
jgi:enoyl-CoA hydratase/carnithine racemase